MRLLAPALVFLALASAPSRAPAQNYVVPQPRLMAPAPTSYQAAPRRRRQAALPPRPGLIWVRKYSDRDTAAYKYILVDPKNPHWTFDQNDWVRFNY